MNIEYKEVGFTEYYGRLIPIFMKHFEELRFKGGPKELNLNIGCYKTLEEMGMHKGFLAHIGEEIVGYASFILTPHIHHKTKIFASADCFYVLPKYRKGRVGIKLLQIAENNLKRIGCHHIQLVVNTNFELDKLMKYLKYETSDIVYTKEII